MHARDAEITAGYLSRLSAAAGESVDVMFTSPAAQVDVDVVRLRHGDANPAGPGFRVTPVGGIEPQRVSGGIQRVYPGSFLHVRGLSVDPAAGPLHLAVWLRPTRPDLPAHQGVCALMWPGGQALAVVLTASGGLGLAWCLAPDNVRLAGETAPLRRHPAWALAVATVDLHVGTAALRYLPAPSEPFAWAGEWRGPLGDGPADAPDAFTAGCGGLDTTGRPPRPSVCFNGKLELPAVLQGGLPDAVWDEVAAGSRDTDSLPGLAAAWRFERARGPEVPDVAGGPAGTLVGAPAQVMTGHSWIGDILNPEQDPAQWGAVHVHDDDVEDAGWEPRVRLKLPQDLRSGAYAVRLRPVEGGPADHVPLFVRPAPGVAGARIAVLMSTFTYLAYGNERLADHVPAEMSGVEQVQGWHDTAIRDHPEYGHSLYDRHSDGSGICYASYLRPILNMRPDYRCWLQGGPRNFAADVSLIDWLDERGYGYDVITDHDLHTDGPALLAVYDVVLTVSHPEYVSAAMLDALEAHRDAGGSLAYLGGNGFYWVTSVDPERPHLIEVQRGQSGTRAWESAPGETYHASTGEPGGLWRYRGRPPNALVSVGFAAMGWDRQAPGFRRQPDSYLPEAAFVFDGIDGDVIGDFGLVMGGAAGDEIDRFDLALGSPPETLVLATSTGHSDFYLQVVDDIITTHAKITGTTNPDVRADMTLLNHPAGGMTFSASAISFLGSLAHNAYDNNVSRLLGNVVDEMLARAAR